MPKRYPRLRLAQFDYRVPSQAIAQKPIRPRDHSRLLVMDRQTGVLQHRHFFDLPQFLQPGDVLVFNNSKVFPARLMARKETGGKLEVFLLRPRHGKTWEVLIGGKIRRIGMRLRFGRGLSGVISKQGSAGVWQVRFSALPDRVRRIAELIGSTPTPPYIKRAARLPDYQTVYAGPIGSVAAPTAGFHFTKRLLLKLKRMGVQLEYVTLHVGFGTFQPITTDDITKHRMHREHAVVDGGTARRIHQAKKEGRRVIAVGTTSVRVLETALARKHIGAFQGWINTYIYPGYGFRMTDAMITNFHVPQSSLLLLVSAFAGREKILRAYRSGLRRGYRFHSFGDAMLMV
ncbi:MAG: tRNA preQ1(34) S-adenosylmethionine ribosyltransferase-isomerase QueA [Candidatus Kerfeldbacteria bacterium]|nr:tRNA preQ1(34) S-adenosylmethionine ribosyltransferase-isomerase QueA [Candidatus Kerfeldbacteria bacterium]